jgi:hypothetical protein
MPNEVTTVEKLEKRLPAELAPEEFVAAVTVVRQTEILDRITSGALYLLWFLCITTMGLYYLVATGHGRLSEQLMTGLARSTVGQVIGLLILIVRGALRTGSKRAAGKSRKKIP